MGCVSSNPEKKGLTNHDQTNPNPSPPIVVAPVPNHP